MIGHRSFSLIEALATMAIGGILLSSAIAATARLIQYQRAELKIAWDVQEEGIIAERWRQFAAGLPAGELVIADASLRVGDQRAAFVDNLLILGERRNRLPAGSTVNFAEFANEPELVTLTVINGTTGEQLRVVGRRGGRGR